VGEQQQQGQGSAAVALSPEAQREVDAIRTAGAGEVARRREVGKLFKMLEGLEWGSGSSAVKGSHLSPATRQAFAEFCFAARANPMYHVDVLGGKPYLNANYWADRLNTSPHFMDYEQVDISRDPEARARWSAPEWALVVVETRIRKLANFAPIEMIRSGEILEFERYLVVTPECNWAGGRKGGKPDPVGEAEAAKTARTRSLRRAAAKAFPVWMGEEDERIRKLEESIQTEFTVIKSEQMAERAALPREGEPQAFRIGAGEPVAARVPEAVEEGGYARTVSRARPRREVQQPAPAPAAEPVDEEALYEAAAAVEEGYARLGIDDVGAFLRDHLEGREPSTLEDYEALLVVLRRMEMGDVGSAPDDDGRLL
jgi:hypothetical protein